VCHKAWCGASPAICCVYGIWRGAVCDTTWCGASPAYVGCMEDVGLQCVIKHGVERHLPYAVCMQDGGVQCVIEHGVERHLPYVVCVKNGGCGA